jgi:hypothetical protein
MENDHTDIYPGALPKDATGFEVNGVIEDGHGGCEVVEDEFALYFSVYAKDSGGLKTCIADLPYRQTADDLAELLSYVLEAQSPEARREREALIAGVQAAHAVLNGGGVSLGHEVHESPNSALVVEYPVCDRIKIVLEENRRMKRLLQELNEAGPSTLDAVRDLIDDRLNAQLMVDREGNVQDIPTR